MFEGTDLSMAYGTLEEPSSMPPAPQAPPAPAVAHPQSTASHERPPDISYVPPPAMFASQSEAPAPVYAYQESFWDRMGRKKADLVKVVMISLMILLALSFDFTARHIVTSYLESNILTDLQEFIVRLSYPVLVILAIWVLKAW